MADNLIICPQCRASIPLSEALSHQIREQARRDLDQALTRQKAEFDEEKKILAEQVAKMNAEAARKLQAERETIEKEAVRRAQEKQAVELRDKDAIIQEQARKIREAQDAEVALRAERRKIEEQQKELTLQLQRKLDEERKRIAEDTANRIAKEQHQKDLESAKREADLKKTIDELKRRVEQGSQQMQGEVVELEIEAQLRDQFPNDVVEPVAKGVRGADVIQRVFRNGKPCGSIIWELKQTKAWSDSWIDKMKGDRDAAKADIAVLVSAVLPKGVTTFSQVNGVWVTSQACLPALAATLRWSMLQLAITRNLAEGKHGKMETLYAYLSGSEFRQRVEAIHDGTMGLIEQLESERRLFEKNWSKRHQLITRVTNGLLNMRGDLEGLGTSLEHIESIDGEREVPPDYTEPKPLPSPRTPRPAEISHRSSIPARDVDVEDDQLF